MPAALKPLATAGVALVGASLITVAPIELQSSGVLERVVTQDYSLTAAGSGLPVTSALPDSSLLYVPINLLNMALSVPAWEVQAMNQFADGMIQTGSWQVWSPTNVFGFDPADPPKLKGFINMLLPIQPFSSVLGQQVSWWAQANLPMNAGCAALPGACPDPAALLNSMFKVSIFDLMKGYTFGDVVNPFTGEKTDWSNTTVRLDPFEAFTNTWKYLTAKPTGPETVTPEYTLATTVKLVKSVFDDFYPFVQNSEYYNDQQTGLAPLFRALAPLLCPTCDPKNPYDNPYLYGNYPPKGVTVDATAQPVAATDAASPADAAGVTRPTPVKTAIENLVKKFQAGSTPAPSAVATDSTAATDAAATGSPAPVSKSGRGFGLGALPTDDTSAKATGSADTSETAAATPAKPTWGIGRHRASDDGTSSSTGSSGKADTSGSSDASGSSARSGTADRSGTAATSSTTTTKKSRTTGTSSSSASEKSSPDATKVGSAASAGATAGSSATAGSNASGGSDK